MKNTFALPTLNYIAFELVKINIDDYLSENYNAEVVETIFLAVIPEQMSYELNARDAIQQTDSDIFINRYDLAPERISFSGTFGVTPRLIAGSYLDGYSRLKQFENTIVRKSKSADFPNESERYLYGVNFYDFTSGRFKSINIQSFKVRRNARENTSFERYECNFIAIGKLINAVSNDPLLSGLKALFGSSGLVDSVLTEVNTFLGEQENILSYATLGLDSIGAAVNLVTGATSFLSGYVSSSQNIYETVESLF